MAGFAGTTLSCKHSSRGRGRRSCFRADLGRMTLNNHRVLLKLRSDGFDTVRTPAVKADTSGQFIRRGRRPSRPWVRKNHPPWRKIKIRTIKATCNPITNQICHSFSQSPWGTESATTSGMSLQRTRRRENAAPGGNSPLPYRRGHSRLLRVRQAPAGQNSDGWEKLTFVVRLMGLPNCPGRGPEQATFSGVKRSPDRDRRAIGYAADTSNEFY